MKIGDHWRGQIGGTLTRRLTALPPWEGQVEAIVRSVQSAPGDRSIIGQQPEDRRFNAVRPAGKTPKNHEHQKEDRQPCYDGDAKRDDWRGRYIDR